MPALMSFSATRRLTGSVCSATQTAPMPPSPICFEQLVRPDRPCRGARRRDGRWSRLGADGRAVQEAVRVARRRQQALRRGRAASIRPPPQAPSRYAAHASGRRCARRRGKCSSSLAMHGGHGGSPRAIVALHNQCENPRPCNRESDNFPVRQDRAAGHAIDGEPSQPRAYAQSARRSAGETPRAAAACVDRSARRRSAA